MKINEYPSLNRNLGERRIINKIKSNRKITIINNHYLKNIREDLLEEDQKHVNSNSNNEIIYVTAKLNGVKTTIMIDTGSNVSLIDSIELEKIQREVQLLSLIHI